jgi:NAD(P)-dependent dehydrogenase (short-subunit alcohol dehydrogenase family)
MPLPKYMYSGPVDHTILPALQNVKGKSVIITGGANGMGEAAVRDFVAAGAFVTFADMDLAKGKIVEKELNADGKVRSAFVQCDIRDWDEQKNMFETARATSPSKSVDIVIANAGISRSSGDSLWELDGMSHSSFWCMILSKKRSKW